MTYKLQWLHISDLHVSNGDSYDRDTVTGAFLDCLSVFVRRGYKPDVVFFTGDLATTGKELEYAPATKFFDRLLSILDLTKDRLFVVPGNHDVDRSRSVGLQRTLHSQDESNKYFSAQESVVHIAKKQASFATWHQSYFGPERLFPVHTTCGPYETVSISGFRLGVIPINTAAFCVDDDDAGKLWIGRRCLDGVTENIKQRADLTVGLMHHPLDWLHEVERAQITSHLREHCDCLLRGHLHKTAYDQIAGSEGSAIHLAAGALYQGSSWPNKASFVQYDGSVLHVTPIGYHDAPKPIWTIDPAIFPDSDDYVGHLPLRRPGPGDGLPATAIGEGASIAASRSAPAVSSVATASAIAEHAVRKPSATERSFEQDLFVGPSGTPLYVEPRLSRVSPQSVSAPESDVIFEKVEDLVASPDSYLIHVTPECGGTSLSKRLAADFHKGGINAALADARRLPNYRAKLRDEFAAYLGEGSRSSVLILDNFQSHLHEKLIKEIQSLDCFSRYIVIQADIGSNGDPPPPCIGNVQSDTLYLWPLGRSGVRKLAADLFDTGDDVFVSSAVDKVYADLLALSIPLTPGNVIMYLKVLYREQDFHPFNRVDIVQKYLTSALSRPSEVFNGVLTSRDKLSILSEFCYTLFTSSVGSFTDGEWHQFCSAYMGDTLTDFCPRELISDLEASRVLVRYGNGIYFKYRFYFNFLVGMHIANRSDLIPAYLSGPNVYTLPGVLETVAGLCGDGTNIVDRVVSDLEAKLADFAADFVPQEFDPLAHAEWGNDGSEDEVWEKISHEIDAGPVPAEELDLIRTTVSLEVRSQDQQVRYTKLKNLEYDVFTIAKSLGDVLKASHGVRGACKKRAIVAYLRTHQIGMQVGVILAKELAKREVVDWGGLRFVGFNAASRKNDEDAAALDIISIVPESVSVKAGEEIGSRKIGEAFKACLAEAADSDFQNLALFSCVLASKPTKWEVALTQAITRTPRRAFYLSSMLQLLMRDYKTGINTQLDRDRLKHLIALIHAKRGRLKEAPGAKLVKETLRRLENEGVLSDGG